MKTSNKKVVPQFKFNPNKLFAIGKRVSKRVLKKTNSSTQNHNAKKTKSAVRIKKLRPIVIYAFIVIAILAPVIYLVNQKPEESEAAWFDETWQYRQRVPITYTGSENLTEYQVLLDDLDTATLVSASKLQSDCDDLRFTSSQGQLLDYFIVPSTCNTSATKIWVKTDTINASDINIYMYYGNPSATAESDIDATFRYASEKTVAYVLHAAVDDLDVISLIDNNSITHNSTTVTLNKYETDTSSFTTISQFGAITAKGLFNADDDSADTDSIVPVSWAGTDFYYYARSTSIILYAIAPWGDATVSAYSAGSVLTGCNATTVATTGTTLNCSGVTNPSAIRVNSDLPIIVFAVAGTTSDPMPLKPATTQSWIGSGSNTVVLNGASSLDWRWISDGDASETNPSDLSANSLDSSSVTGDGSYGQGAILIRSANSIYTYGVNQYGDGDGTDGHMFQDVTEVGTEFGSAHQADYISVAATTAATCSVYNNGTLAAIATTTATSSNSSIYSAEFGTSNSTAYTTSAWHMSCDAPVVASWQDAVDSEENLMHHVQMRQFTYPTPAVGTLATEEESTGPISYWKFDEGQGTTYYDQMGRNDGTLGTGSSAPQWATADQCLNGRCLFLDGSNDYTDATNTGFSASAGTVSLWAKPTTAADGTAEYIYMGNTNNNRIYIKRLATSGNFSIRLGTPGDIDTSRPLVAGEWYHIGLTWDGGTYYAYLDGVQVSTGAYSGLSAIASCNSIGAYSSCSGTTNGYFAGYVDELKVYSYARTADEIKQDYVLNGASSGVSAQFGGNNLGEVLSNGLVGYWKMNEDGWNGTSGEAADSSGSGNNGTAAGNATALTSTGKYGRGGTFDGTGDYVTVTNSSTHFSFPDDQLTISSWVYFDTLATNDFIIGKSQSNIGFSLRLDDASSSNLEFYVGDGSTYTYTTKAHGMSTGTWYHVAAVYDKGKMEMFVNGKSLGADNNSLTPSWGTNNLILASDAAGGNGMDGSLDEVRLYNRALPTSEVALLYEWGPDPIAYWSMNEGTGTSSVIDSSGNEQTLTMNGTMTSSDWTPGKYSSGLSFDGSNDYLSRSNSSTFDFGTGSFSVSGWFKTTPNTVGGSSYSQRVATGSDDAEEAVDDNLVDIGSSDLELVDEDFEGEQQVGMRFTNVTIAQGSSIDSAYVQFQVDESTTITTDLVITGEDVDDASTFTTSSGNITSRTKTSASVAWSVPSWPTVNDEGADQRTSDISSIIEEIVARPGWVSGNDIVIMINGDGQRIAESYDGESTAAAQLNITPSTVAPQYIVSRYNDTGYKVWIDSSGLLNFGIDDDSTWGPDDVATSTADLTDGEWHHFTAKKDANAGGIYLYVDGVLVGSDTSLTATGTLSSATADFVIGTNEPTNNGYFAGTLDEIKVYNYSLNEKQVIKDMNANHPSVGSPVASPMLEYHFDEGYGTAINNTGNAGSSLDGTITGATWTNDGKYNKSLSYDGSGDYVAVASSSRFDFGTDDFSITTWINPTSTGGEEPIFDMRPANTAHSLFYKRTNDTLRYQDRPAAGSITTLITSTSTISAGEWTHTALVRRSGTWYIYINGRVDATSTTSLDLDAGGSPRVGQYQDSDINEAFDGEIDEFKVYDYGLSDDEVKTDYNQGKAATLGSSGTTSAGVADNSSSREYCVPGDSTSCSAPVAEWRFDEGVGTSANDTSGNGNTGLLGTGSSAPQWAHGKFGGGLSFDGSNDYVSGTDLDITGNLSISAWVKTSSTSTQIIVRKVNAYELFIVNTANCAGATVSGSIGMVIGDGTTWGCGSGDIGFASGTTSVADNRWHYVSGTYSDSADTINIYVDGVLQTSKTNATRSLGTNNNSLYLGSTESNQFFMSGLIDQVRIYDYTRTNSQDIWDYSRGVPVAWFKLDECEGTTIYNSAPTFNDSAAGGDGTLNIGGSGSQTTVGTCSTSGAWSNGASGKYAASMNFDGTDDNISTSSVYGITSTTNVTLAAWVNLPDTSESGSFVKLGSEDGGDNDGFAIGVGSTTFDNEGNNFVMLYEGVRWINTSVALGTGWHHVAMVVDSSGVPYAYVDGKYRGSFSGTGADAPESDDGLKIGGYTSSGAANRFGSYQIDDVRVYNYPVTAKQILDIYNSGTVRFD